MLYKTAADALTRKAIKLIQNGDEEKALNLVRKVYSPSKTHRWMPGKAHTMFMHAKNMATNPNITTKQKPTFEYATKVRGARANYNQRKFNPVHDNYTLNLEKNHPEAFNKTNILKHKLTMEGKSQEEVKNMVNAQERMKNNVQQANKTQENPIIKTLGSKTKGFMNNIKSRLSNAFSSQKRIPIPVRAHS